MIDDTVGAEGSELHQHVANLPAEPLYEDDDERILGGRPVINKTEGILFSETLGLACTFLQRPATRVPSEIFSMLTIH